ncbi:MAG: hypothetical protein U0350_42925 [Caldilineaceae bacterium]
MQISMVTRTEVSELVGKMDKNGINGNGSVGHPFQGDNGPIVHLSPAEELQLWEEFAEWEAASDEDWLKLEESL